MFCHWTIQDSVIIWISSIQMKLEVKRKIKNKCDDFIFPIVNFSFTSRNISAAPANRVYLSQLVCYSRACYQNSIVLDGAQMLTQKLLKQTYVAPISWSRPNNNVKVVIMNWLSGSFPFYVIIFFPISYTNLYFLLFFWVHLFIFIIMLCCVLFCFVCLYSVFCVQCWMCFWIVHIWLTIRFSLTCI